MNDAIKIRLNWINIYLKLGNTGVACQKCGISRPTLIKWLNCYKELGIEVLNQHSSRPKKIKTKVTAEDEERIIDLRDNRKFRHRSFASEMKRLYESSLSTATIQKILIRNKRRYLTLKRSYR